MRKLLISVLLLCSALAVYFVFFNDNTATTDSADYKGPKEVSTYFSAPLMTSQEVQDSLSKQGFEIVSVSKVSKQNLESIVFTHAHLKALANKSGRGFLAGSLRALVNTADKEIRITNPRYFVRAFLQDDYKMNDELPLLDALNKAFPTLTPSADKWEFEKLADYSFMIGRPHYQDVIEIANGTSEELKAKIEKNAKKNLIFKIELSETSTLYGVNLGSRTMKFVDKIGAQNAGLLPWMVLVENGKATAMRADYYIAITYPLLDMTGFMGIMTVPGAVEKDLGKYFK